MSDIIQIVDLLLRGPSGWLVLGVSMAAPSVLTYLGVKHRFKNVRETTHALVGGDGRFQAQNERDVDNMFSSFDRYEKRLQALRHELVSKAGDAPQKAADQMIAVANQMREECGQMSELNIAFRTQAAHKRFIDRIAERYSRAKAAYEFAAKAKRVGAEARRAG